MAEMTGSPVLRRAGMTVREYPAVEDKTPRVQVHVGGREYFTSGGRDGMAHLWPEISGKDPDTRDRQRNVNGLPAGNIL